MGMLDITGEEILSRLESTSVCRDRPDLVLTNCITRANDHTLAVGMSWSS